MGWFGTYTSYANASEYAAGELDVNQDYKIIDRAIKKDKHLTAVVYTLVQKIATGEKTIQIDFINRDGDHWSHKPFNESSGPCVYTCPKAILKQSDCNNPVAVEWRKKCYEQQTNTSTATKTIIALFKKMKAGTVIKIGQSTLVYSHVYNKTGTQVACQNESGNTYRYSIKDFTIEALESAIAANQN